MLLPRPVETRPRIRRKVWVALTLLAAVSMAGLLALRERPPTTRIPLGESVRVATYNVHYGFDEQWRYDPSRIADALRDVDADVVALQEVTAAMPTAYGTDLGTYLARRLGMRVRFAPAINGLLGDAMLIRVPPEAFAAALLPPARSDRKAAARVTVPAGRASLNIFGTHFGLEPHEQEVQTTALLEFIGNASPAILLGDFNATGTDPVLARLRAVGFEDAFATARAAPAFTFPASAPEVRIDWIWVRGVQATAAAVHDGVASDHRLVFATVLVPATTAADSARHSTRK
jgi:endonuclease/exonuclease/phosphatase family metal-dependent hydrolase